MSGVVGARPPENPIARQLHIKFGVVQRTQKELTAYHAELAANRAKVESMRACNADEFDIKKQVSGLDVVVDVDVTVVWRRLMVYAHGDGMLYYLGGVRCV